jgi:hypothetical protein
MTTTKTLQRALGILFKTVTLAADVFRDATSNDEVEAQYIVHGTAKSWANLNGTGTIALRDSLNVASVVDNGTGDYTFNFGNEMSAADYKYGNSVGNLSGVVSFIYIAGSGRYNAGNMRFFTVDQTYGTADRELINFDVHGDLA